MATTIRQVAAAAGVSVATASRALNGSNAVVESTRARVLRVAAELDYTPSRLGRSLATGSTGNIGVILPDLTNPFYTSFLAELESLLAAHDVGVLVGDSHESAEAEQRLIERMATQVDTLVLASSRLGDDAIVAASARLPVILANRALENVSSAAGRLSQFTIDVEPGFREAVEHVLTLGHRALTYIDGPPRSWSGRQKARVLAAACAESGMTMTTVPAATPDFEGGRAAYALIDGAAQHGGHEPSAVIAFNDQVALGLLSALREAGRTVPHDTRVIGCDNSLPDGLAWPALTTVDSSSRKLAALAGAAILTPDAPRTGTVSTRLIVRASTGQASTGQPVPLRTG